MTRYAVYALPGALGGGTFPEVPLSGAVLRQFEADGAREDAPEALRLREAVEAWYAREEFRDLTVDARRYGFHATLKAPFRLAEGRTEAELRAAADTFAAARRPVTIAAPRPATVGHFRALLPHGDHAGLDALAADAVRAFDDFRAQPNEDEIRRRRPERLSPRERELFERWGYPYVFDRFRFHLTLTDPIPEERIAEVDAALASHFADTAGIDVPLLSIALFVEPEPGDPFDVLSVHPFAAAQESTR
ncbi:DUF1045 domain-containing protein [Microbacterium sp. JZ31]|uniref:DUF1045 domain-containing protein n=1 Tax=Microbacterium sp. JZ31 TaxID=1906274 RepID=UPI0019338227|nr:DUF1045 domain-containing protein [Microbacterium sp. JZ31]